MLKTLDKYNVMVVYITYITISKETFEKVLTIKN